MDKKGQSVYAALAFIVIASLIVGIVLNEISSGSGNPAFILMGVLLAVLIIIAIAKSRI